MAAALALWHLAICGMLSNSVASIKAQEKAMLGVSDRRHGLRSPVYRPRAYFRPAELQAYQANAANKASAKMASAVKGISGIVILCVLLRAAPSS